MKSCQEIEFIIDRLSSSSEFLCQSTFFANGLSLSIVFLHHSTLHLVKDLNIFACKYISSCMQQCGKLLIPQNSEKLFGLEELLSFLLEYLYSVNHLQIDVAILMFKL